MNKSIQIGLAQINPLVGDIEANVDAIIAYAKQAKAQQCDLVVFSELVLTGYPPEDLLFRPGFLRLLDEQLTRLGQNLSGIDACISYPKKTAQGLYNVAAMIVDGQLQREYYKQRLPNYSVFDEQRYFQAGDAPIVMDYKSFKLGLSVCEDIWHDGPIEASVAQGAEVIINVNASPYHSDKIAERRSVVCQRAQANGVPIIYVNQVGGQDELVFDGASFVSDDAGEVVHQMPSFESGLSQIQVLKESEKVVVRGGVLSPQLNQLASIYQALILGVRDYVRKNHFSGVVIGLSGGIDSALTTAIAVDALGKENVTALMMPFTYTSDMSKQDAREQAEKLGVEYHVISIEPMYNAFVTQLSDIFSAYQEDKTEENIQARCRGLLLMAYSNKTGKMVLTTGNKSEMSVGYATLYGDMVGGFNAIKDVPKTLVYALAEYRNTISDAIPQRVITRAPSAELRPDQVDQDSLPEYDVLDAIIELYVEQDVSPAQIVAQGFSSQEVLRVCRMVDVNEYKRRQSAPGVRISKRAYGRDRRYPITSGYRPKVD